MFSFFMCFKAKKALSFADRPLLAHNAIRAVIEAKLRKLPAKAKTKPGAKNFYGIIFRAKENEFSSGKARSL